MTSMGSCDILHIVNSLECGGAEHLALETVRALAARGWRPALCALGGNRMPEETSGLRVAELRARGFSDPLGFARLARLVLKWRPRVIHTHLIWSDLWGCAAARLARTAILVSTAHSAVDRRARSAPLRYLCCKAARRRSWTLAISNAVAAYRAEQGEPLERMSVLPNAVDVGRFAAGDGLRMRRGWGIPTDLPLIGCVARLDPIKGLTVLLRAFARLRASRARLVIVGGGPEEAALRALARSCGAGERVTFAGALPRREIPDALAAFDAFVLPSLHEGLGIAIIEAMAAGRPVVASRVDGIPELVRHRETGLLAPPGDAEGLARMLDLLLARPTFALALGRAAQAEAWRRFDLSPYVSRLEALYRRLLPEPGALGRRISLGGMP